MKDKINDLVQVIEENTDRNGVYVKIDFDERHETPLIEGNINGLRLLAVQLLKQSLEMEEETYHPVYSSEVEWEANNEALTIRGVNQTREEILRLNKDALTNPGTSNRISGWGCLLMILLLAGIFICGIIYVIDLFQ